MKKKFWLYLDGDLTHNSLTIKSDKNVIVMSITAIIDDGSELEIVGSPLEIHGDTSVSYKPISSNRLRVTISHPLSDILKLDELVNISVSLQDYIYSGHYISPVTDIAFGEQASVVHEIENVLDVFLKCTISLKTLDSYGNVIYSNAIPISINQDGFMVSYNDNDTLEYIDLDYEPDQETLYILVGSEKTKEFSVKGKRVIFHKPRGYRAYAVYKPLFATFGSRLKISEDIFITPSYDLILKDSYCSKIKFSLELEMLNPDVTKITHTPVIKSIGLMVSSS